MVGPDRAVPVASLVELTRRDAAEAARVRVERREAAVAAIEDTLASAAVATASAALRDLARLLPLAVSCETATVHLRARDREHRLHLVGATGFPPRDLFALALEPMDLARARALLLLGADHSAAREFGLRSVDGSWLPAGDEVAGVVVVGSRTSRRASQGDLRVLAEIAARLAEAVAPLPRTTEWLERASSRVARGPTEQAPGLGPGPVSGLRRREWTVLELLADGLTTREVADVLVISQHTVRTHVRNALRGLGVHSRHEAMEVVLRKRLKQVV